MHRRGRATHEPAQVTPRQKTVLEMVARGLTNFEIAQQLGISLDGAKWHLRELFARLGVDSREEAAAWWRQHNSPRERISRRTRAILPTTALRWLAFGAGSIATAVLITAAIAAITIARGHDGGASEEPPATTSVSATAGSSDRSRLIELSPRDISNRPEIAGVRLVPTGTPALWDAQFVPQAGHSLAEAADASGLSTQLPFALEVPPAGYSLDAAGLVLAVDVQPSIIVSGGARYVRPDSPYAVSVELHGVQDGKVVEVSAPARSTASTVWQYTTPGGADVLVFALSPGGGAEPVMEADVAQRGIYARVSMPELSLDAALAFLNDFLGG